MDTGIKRAMIVAGITTALGLPLSGQASDGTITFTGAVTANTCAITVTSNGVTSSGAGSATATVALPTVSTAALTNAAASGSVAAKTTAAGTFFNITLSGCTATADIGGTAAPASVGVYFEAGPNVDTLTGGLINPIVTGSSNVEVYLYLASKAAIVTSQVTPGSSVVQATPIALTGGATGGTQYFYAGYSTAANGAASAGSVNTSVTYSLVYL